MKVVTIADIAGEISSPTLCSDDDLPYPEDEADKEEVSMHKEQALPLLRDHKSVLLQRFGVVDIALFGSFARGEASPDNDVDILVRFDGPADWRR
ncbi:MAG: nucleotidyltransferase domain-containing protein [Halieaceae bacterium]|nr:nucleotidyltransferase domain-containing protein [Halieaceae bacterium]